MALTEEEKKEAIELYNKQKKLSQNSKKSGPTEPKMTKEEAAKSTKEQNKKVKQDAKKEKEIMAGRTDPNLYKTEAKPKTETEVTPKKTTNNATGKAQQFSYVANKPASFSAKAISSEAEKKPMSATQYGKTQLSNQIYDKYRTIEKYYNDPTGNSLEKGLFNRLRSAGGETVENIARIIDDNISDNPEERMFNSKFADFLNTNAKNVIAKNTAGQIGDLADQQIMQAKENTGNFGDFLIDTADAGANMASQAILARVLLPGAPTPVANKVFSGVQGVSAGAQKYVDTREAGGNKAEAFQRGIGSGAIAAITEGLTGIGKTGVSKIPGVDRVVTHLDEFATKNWLTNVLSTGLGEGGEEGLEYAFEYASDVIADLIYKGEIETDFNVAELFQNVASGFVLGAGFGTVGGTANAYQNYDPNAKNKPNNVETNTPAEPPVSPVEAPIAEAENVTPETANEQEGAFANATERIKELQEERLAVEVTLKNLENQNPITAARDRVVWDEKLEQINNEIESIIREVSPEALESNAQVNPTNDAIEPTNDVIEPFSVNNVDQAKQYLQENWGYESNEAEGVDDFEDMSPEEIVEYANNFYFREKFETEALSTGYDFDENNPESVKEYLKKHGYSEKDISYSSDEELVIDAFDIAIKENIAKRHGFSDFSDFNNWNIAERFNKLTPEEERYIERNDNTEAINRYLSVMNMDENLYEDSYFFNIYSLITDEARTYSKGDPYSLSPKAAAQAILEAYQQKNRNPGSILTRAFEIDGKKLPESLREQYYPTTEERIKKLEQNIYYYKDMAGYYDAVAKKAEREENTEYAQRNKANAQKQREIAKAYQEELKKLTANAQPRAQGDGGFGENTVGAAQSNPTSYAHLQNEHGVFEPGEQPLARDPNVPLKDAQGNRVSQSVRTIMEAKVTPDELIPAFEKEVAAGTFQNKGTTNKEAVEKAAVRIANKSFKDAVSDFETLYSDDKLLSKDDLVFGELLFSMAAQNSEADTAMKIASLLSSNNSRTGDAMQAQRILKRLSPEGRLYHAQRITDKFNKDKRQKNEIKLSQETVKKVLNAKTDEEIEAANDAVAEDIAKQIERGFFDDLAGMWNAWRYLSMLGNPKTHIRNIFGNLAFLPVRKLKNVVKAGIESGAYKAGWIDEKTASVKLASKENREFAKESFEKNKKALLSGGNYRFESEIDSKIEPFRFTGKETPVKKFWNAVLTPARKGAEFNSNALEAEDVWFLESAYIDSLTQYLTANKIDAQNITPKQKTKAENYAAQEAKKATYRDDSAIANALEKLSNTEISFKGIKIKLRPFVDAVVPFRKTPINILARAVEYSPVGLATTLALDGRAVKNGDITANEMIDHVSSGLTGSGIYALGIALALKGVLTGGEDEDKNEKEFAKLQGEQPYALKIGDGSYTLDWLAPTAIPLFLGAETVRVLKKEYGEDEKWDDVVWEILVNLDKIANPMLELSMLQNLDSFLGSNYSKDGNALSGLAQDLIASYVLQAVPTLSSQIAQTKDGTRRNAYYIDKTDKIPDEWQIPLQRAMAKIPGLSEKIPAYVDAWGREQKQSENIGVRIAENFLSPGYYKKKTVTEVDEMLKQLYADTGESSILPKNFAKSFNVDGENLNLSGKQYVDAQKKKGQTAYNMLDQLIADKDFNKLSSEQKASIVSDVYSYANVKGKQEVSNYATDTKWYKNIEEAKSKHGISNADYLIAKNHYSNLDGDNKKTKMLDQLIADKGTSAKQDVALMEYIAGVDMSKYKKATSEPSKQLALYKIKNDATKGKENDLEQIQKEFKENVYGAREIYYKSEGDWSYNIDDVIDNGKNRDKKVSVYKKFGLSEGDIVKGYNATIGYNKKEDLMAALTDAFGSKKKATTFYNVFKGKKGYK